jgi:uncharacterized tellurite resistance protein B-like protein
MSVIDRAMQEQGRGVPPLRLTVPEAFAAILVAAVAADGTLSESESDRLRGALATCRILPPNPPDGGPNVVERALTLLTDHGLPAVLTACAQVLPPDLRPTAFAQATDLVLADGRIAQREKAFIDELQEVLQVDDVLALKIVEVLLVKNRG